MKIRFVILLLLFLGHSFSSAAANAAAPGAVESSNACDEFLSSVVSEADSSSPASDGRQHAYVRVIEHYMKQKQLSVNESAQLVKTIAASKKPINPFLGAIDTLSGQISKALETILPKISQKEWREIKVALGAVQKENTVKAADRSEKNSELAFVVGPKVRQTFSMGMHAPNAMDSFTYQGRTLFTIFTNHTLYFFELVKGELKEFSRLGMLNEQADDSEVGGYAWLTTGSRSLLAVNMGKETLALFELQGNTLVRLSEQSMAGYAPKMSWQTVNDRTFLFIDSSEYKKEGDRKIIQSATSVYELEDNKLKLVDQLQHDAVKIEKSGHARAVLAYREVRTSVLQINDQLILAAKANDEIKLYVIENGKFSRSLQIVKVKGELDTGVEWATDESGNAYLATATEAGLFVYRYIDNKLDLIGTGRSSFGLRRKPTWIKSEDGLFILGASKSTEMDYYQVTEKGLSGTQTILAGADTYGEANTMTFKDEVFSAYAVTGGVMTFLSHRDGELIERAKLKAEATSGHKPAWIVLEDNAYLVVSDFYGVITVIELLKSLKPGE